ncbi:MAG TPA: capsid cement protein [Candidatus Bathyarchaeia archaeon]|nr:capsid cement protein [Candidatus Bathyarchaeia archaeon]
MADLTGLPNLSIGDLLEPVSGAFVADYEAAAAVTRGDPVYLSSDGKVSPATSDQNCIGIAVKDAAVGVMCPVCVRGRVKVKAGGSITRGKAVKGADSSRRVVALADINEGGTATVSWTLKLGVAEQSATAADDLISIFVAK